MIGTRKVVSSAMWRIVETAGTEGISFLFFVVLTRLLVPEQFGAVALAGGLIQVLQTLLYQGLPDALIQRADVTDRHFRAAQVGSLMIGLALWALASVAAYPLGWALGRPDFPLILIAMAPVLVVQAISAPLHAMLRRSLDYRSVAIRTLSGIAAGGVLAITLASAGWGIWALVVQQWTVAAVSLVVLVWLSPLKPWPLAPDPALLRSLMAFARPILVGQFVTNAARRLDIVVLGLFVGDHEVGNYFLISRLLWAVQMVTQHSLSELTLVVLSRFQRDPQQHREGARRALRLTAYLCLLCFGGLAVVAPQLIPLGFGSAWSDAIEPLRVLALFAASGAIVATAGWSLVSAGRSGEAGRLAIACSLLQLAAIMLSARHGLLAMAWVLGLAQLFTIVPALHLLARTFSLSRRQLLADLLPIVAGFACAVAAAQLPAPAASPIAGVLAGSVFSVLMLAAGVLVFRHELPWRGASRGS